MPQTAKSSGLRYTSRFSGPGMMLVDFSLLKRFRVTEGQSIEFRIDSTNIFNHAVFKMPGTSTGDPDFGRTTSTYGPRRIQFYLRYSF
jgi:hypothetical protein